MKVIFLGRRTFDNHRLVPETRQEARWLRNHKLSKAHKVMLVAMPMLFITLTSVLLFVNFKISSLAKIMHEKNDFQSSRSAKVYHEKKPVNILLLGTDTGELGRTDRGRTDTIMIATINPQKKKILLTSISRDTLSLIVGHEDEGFQKLNAAYTFGGVSASAKTISKYLNVPIDGYLLVNMKGLVESINHVDGIKVKSPLTFTFSPDTSHETGKVIYKFTQNSSDFTVSHDYGKTWKNKSKMNGQDALAFSRMRYQDPNGDYGRQLRQRLVIMAMLNKVKNYQSLLSQSFLNSIASSMRTNYDLTNLTEIADNYHSAIQNISSQYLKGQDKQVDGIAYQYSTDSQKQKVTDSIRDLLDLGQEDTGTKYGGKDTSFSANSSSGSSNTYRNPAATVQNNNSDTADDFAARYNANN